MGWERKTTFIAPIDGPFPLISKSKADKSYFRKISQDFVIKNYDMTRPELEQYCYFTIKLGFYYDELLNVNFQKINHTIKSK